MRNFQQKYINRVFTVNNYKNTRQMITLLNMTYRETIIKVLNYTIICNLTKMNLFYKKYFQIKIFYSS
jgi:hypothetical protein